MAKEEAMATGAYFGKTMLQIGMELEDKVFERWKQWATKKASEQEQQRAAMYTGMENESAGQPEESSETRAALANLEGLIPPIEAQGKEVDGSVPAGQ